MLRISLTSYCCAATTILMCPAAAATAAQLQLKPNINRFVFGNSIHCRVPPATQLILMYSVTDTFADSFHTLLITTAVTNFQQAEANP